MPSHRHATFAYKTVGDLPIEADVSRPDDDELRPVILWMHGGGLDVDCGQSFTMAGLCKSHGVEHDLVLLEGAEHGLRGIPPEQAKAALKKAVDFVRRKMEP